MSINPIDENSTPKTTGSLEELFRHHLGEEAAVPPRPMLWDQIDNSLLIRQNETYRRRLTVTRWVAAASLLLATLAGTGWWSIRDARLGGTDVAQVGQQAVSRTGAAAGDGGRVATGKNGHFNSSAATVAASKASTQASAANSTSGHFGAAANDAYSTNQYPSGHATAAIHQAIQPADFGPASARKAVGNDLENGLSDGMKNSLATAGQGNTGTAGTNASGFAAKAADYATNQALTARTSQAATAGTAGATSTAAGQGFATVAAESVAASSLAASATAATSTVLGASAMSSTTAVATAEQLNLLAARLAALQLAAPTALPNGLAKVAVPAESLAPADAHRWHYGASYTAGMFNPNVNFSRAGIASEHDYNPALGADSPALTEAAAAQYRQNLRPGLSQRIALLATRHLAGHWSLSTGAEFSQATAQSATSSTFVGEQILDLGQSRTGSLRTTNFRYRMASIPVEIRYANPVKRGWSLYGRLGGVVSALLGVRSEVEGNPEATKTYSFASAGMPYRRVLGSVRGGAGAQFRNNTGKWALTLGPVAEFALTPLNAHPAQGLFSQSRAYSFGIEAGMEFGR